ncbi:Zinc finger CCCH domain-containing protein 15 [Intoshia linei]|uniref:Zinc finger CCCH domain-containing protein 15 n=1 Tax=Intoshia linei TaxID=1819745 RepID=A0A177B9X1_9BILA|nr:Zinc finger CCCH domain-containing protein 15 [Intoshia linei]
MPKKPTITKNEPKKERVTIDRTFGLKNKKGAKQQKFITNVKNQKTADDIEKQQLNFQKKNKKLKDEQERKELNMLFKTFVPKNKEDENTKNILCLFFKNGKCSKGKKCKFSHDLSQIRKSEKRSVFEDDAKDNDLNLPNDSNNLTRTNKICKHFLEAIDKSKYGWFWQCPNGEKCVFRHSLPKDYVLKKKKKKVAQVNVEDAIMKELLTLQSAIAEGAELTQISLENFIEWKEYKKSVKRKAIKSDIKIKKTNVKKGVIVKLTGREIFSMKIGQNTKNDTIAADKEEILNINFDKKDDCQIQNINLKNFENRYLSKLKKAQKMSQSEDIIDDIDEDLFLCSESDESQISESENQPNTPKMNILDKVEIKNLDNLSIN